MIKLIVLLFLTTEAFANSVIINPHFGHTIMGEISSNALDSDSTIQGLSGGLRVLFRHDVIYYGVDLERTSFKVNSSELTDGFSSSTISLMAGLRFSANEYFGKFTFAGEATLYSLGSFATPVGFEIGYLRRFIADGVTKIALFASYSSTQWDDFSNNTVGSSIDLEVSRILIGVSIPFEITL
jgi:hypothetical protein